MKPTRARVYPPTAANLARLSRALKRGELVAAPTETVYGLAGNALDARVARSIFKAKGRPASDPLIVHIASLAQLRSVAVPNTEALALAKAFWPGPLTLVLEKTKRVPLAVTSGGESVAVRMPSHPLFRRLIRGSGLPLAAPSANAFGYVSPTSAEHVLDGLGSRIAHILDGGSCSIGVESTVLDLRDPKNPRILRPGAISAAQIARILNRPVAIARRSPRSKAPLAAPGLLKRHYSPRTPVVLHRTLSISAALKRPTNEAWLFLRAPKLAPNIHSLDPKGSLKGAARALFATLRLLDKAGYTAIHVELMAGTHGLAEAINDRLRRAAAR